MGRMLPGAARPVKPGSSCHARPVTDAGRVVVARAPGRVNLIGDHTDYNDGLALPMAVDLTTEVELVEDASGRLRLASDVDPRPVVIPLGPAVEPLLGEATGAAGPAGTGRSLPSWARLAVAVVGQVDGATGGTARVTSSVPVGAGLSSSASFCVALATAVGAPPTPVALARLGQQAEAAIGAAVGLMDPLVVAGARAGHAMLVDFATLDVEHVPIPDDVAIVVVHSGEARRLADSPYGARRSECAAAAARIGRPLGRATETDVSTLTDPVLRRRARHVVTEGDRVQAMTAALREGDAVAAGRLMVESHRSLSGDFDASTPTIDALVDDLLRRPGVHGARMTGGGFGGCVVALTRPGAIDPAAWGRAWVVQPSAGVSRQVHRAG